MSGSDEHEREREHERKLEHGHDKNPPHDKNRAHDHNDASHAHRRSHTGNGTVNHGPDGGDAGASGSGADEAALRRLLHQAVDEIEPRDGTLEHLRRAVPARRARKRQALVGVAAAVLFVGTAVPAVVHVSHTTSSDTNTAAVGNTQDAQGSRGRGKEEGGAAGSSSGSAGATESPGGSSGDEKKRDEAEAATDGGADPTASPSPPESVQACTADQLGGATASAGAPDASGAVYGSFRVANVSGIGCTVSGAGGVSPTAQGAADQSKLLVTGHVAGDAATGLPDPALAVPQLLLQPGAAYEVKFAWVPSEACPTTGGGSTPDPLPEPSPTGSAPDTGGTVPEDTGTTTQLLTADGIADGSVAVTHTAPGGVPSVTTTVSNACAGTVYWTGLLAAG
ncbi:hypothetical protein [Streptomyces sp. CRN 30]|uniref:hypothetical protein n=1 Tax=Streptomyces sp. CRN 30 TaxID=3075613 RepID=UPI002A7F781A|nr:hypothetical protein [Streptomyces sp. CRN 30]